jgi:hypothetical protein
MATQPPVVVGLTLCRDFLRDPASGNYSVIRSFTGHPIRSFPGTGEPFCVFAILTDAIGDVDAELVVTRFGEEGIVEFARTRVRVRFTDRLGLVECAFRFNRFPFPGPGAYLFGLYLGGEWAAQRALRVYTQEAAP